MNQLAIRTYKKLPTEWNCKFSPVNECHFTNYFSKDGQLVKNQVLYTKLQNDQWSNESIALQEITGSPLDKTYIGLTLPNKNQITDSTMGETSFTNQINIDFVVKKIRNMFPTASESHIRLLLKKYYNREAVVISALQVGKYPVTMPGPFVTPQDKRHFFSDNKNYNSEYLHPTLKKKYFESCNLGNTNLGLLYNDTSRNSSPLPSYNENLYNTLKQHSSPKMKLKYMKTIFPQSDEVLLLDTLANVDNNVQKASKELISMGYIKHEFLPSLSKNNKEIVDIDKIMESNENLLNKRENKIMSTQILTEDDKDYIKRKLIQKYSQLSEDVIVIALQTTNYNEKQASKILQIVNEEDNIKKQIPMNVSEICENNLKSKTTDFGSNKNIEVNVNTRNENKTTTNPESCEKSMKIQSLSGNTLAKGPNSKLFQGYDEDHLRSDYVNWIRANPDIQKGRASIARGPNAALLVQQKYKAFGHNSNLSKGPEDNFSKSSMYNRKKYSDIN